MVKEAFYVWGIIGAGLGVALYITYKDVREFIVPTVPLVLFLLLGLSYRFAGSADGLVMLGGVGFIYVLIFGVMKILEKLKGRSVLGYGDLHLMAGASVWLPFQHLPLLFIVIGVSGVLLKGAYWRQTYYPFAPAILVGWFVVLLVSKV